MAHSARRLMAGLICLVAAAEAAAPALLRRQATWHSSQDGPMALDITKEGRLMPRFRPPGYGSPRPVCPVGWLWNGRRCVDVDECRQRNECRGDTVYCMNTLGSYRCMCQPGLVGDYYTVGCKTEEEYCLTRFRDAGDP